ncbi:MAG: hypothetical protein LBN32_02290 [Helicobacteraceae bacterium]|nr:hypothetical protein [Helicobacteraceae bacterium]
MSENIFHDDEFAEIMSDHAYDIIGFLVESEIAFSILCALPDLSFEPPLPEKIARSLKPLTLFALNGYTLESAGFDDEGEMFSFEAGFGSENFGSLVSVPAKSIVQILYEDAVIFVNLTALPQYQKKSVAQPVRITRQPSIENSISNFLDNPENSKFLK